MYKDGIYNFKFVGYFDTTSFKQKALSLTDEDWNEYTERQGGVMYRLGEGEHKSPHSESRTIPLLFNDKFGDIPEQYKWYSEFKDEVESVRTLLREYYGQGNMPRIILTKLLAERNILPHVDTGEQLLKCKRHHIPLMTNPDVMFHVGDDSINMKQGEVWEINNSNLHHVRNYSLENRIHIIVDWDINLR